MNFLKNSVFIAFFIFHGAIYGQKTVLGIDNTTSLSQNKASNIISSTAADSVLIKIEVKDALYDFNKNNLPYFVISKITSYNQNANPTLIIKKFFNEGALLND
ncbi:MAG: hypothetical protein WCH21_02535, partial [Bacteroidota bacterium]